MKVLAMRNDKIHKSQVFVMPVRHHYEEPGEKPKIKYTCPVCDQADLRHAITEGEDDCPCCGVHFFWPCDWEEWE